MTKRSMNAYLYLQWLLLKPTLLGYGGMLVSYWVLAFFGLFSGEIAIAMGQLVIMLSPLALFSMEESTSFQDVSVLFPSGRVGVVVARYLFALGLTAVSTLVTMVAIIAWGGISGERTFSRMLALMLSTLLGLVFLELSLPILYQLGSKEGKPWFFLLVLTPVAFFVMVLPQLEEYLEQRIFSQDPVTTFAWLLLGIGLALLGFFPSFALSLKIFAHKSLD